MTVRVAVGRTREHDGRRRPRGARGWARRGVHACQPSRGVPQRFRASPRGRLGDEGPTRSTRDSCQTAAAMRPSAANPAAAKAAARTGISAESPPRRSVMVGRGVGGGVVGAGAVVSWGARRSVRVGARAVEAGGEQDAAQQAVLRHRWRVNAENEAFPGWTFLLCSKPLRARPARKGLRADGAVDAVVCALQPNASGNDWVEPMLDDASFGRRRRGFASNQIGPARTPRRARPSGQRKPVIRRNQLAS